MVTDYSLSNILNLLFLIKHTNALLKINQQKSENFHFLYMFGFISNFSSEQQSENFNRFFYRVYVHLCVHLYSE